MIARRCIIRGRVQGVGFRYFVCDVAARLGVFGWVANRHDGTVETHVEADDSRKMDEFITLIRTGPRFAAVDDVDVREVQPENHQRFRITR